MTIKSYPSLSSAVRLAVGHQHSHHGESSSEQDQQQRRQDRRDRLSRRLGLARQLSTGDTCHIIPESDEHCVVQMIVPPLAKRRRRTTSPTTRQATTVASNQDREAMFLSLQATHSSTKTDGSSRQSMPLTKKPQTTKTLTAVTTMRQVGHHYTEPLVADHGKGATAKATKSRVSFASSVDVQEIPSFRDYSREERAAMWTGLVEIDINADRNCREFWADGRDWRTATEEDAFGLWYDETTGRSEWMHPVTLQRHQEEEEERYRLEVTRRFQKDCFDGCHSGPAGLRKSPTTMSLEDMCPDLEDEISDLVDEDILFF